MDGGDASEVIRTLVAAVDQSASWRELQGVCLDLLDHADLWVRSTAVSCLGHLATIHHSLDVNVVKPRLEELALSDPDLSDRIRWTLEDIDSALADSGTEEEWTALSRDWFRAVVAAEFARYGFESMEDGNPWPMALAGSELQWTLQWSDSKSARDSASLLVGVGLVAGPQVLRVRWEQDNGNSVLRAPVGWTAAQFSPGIDVGVPSEEVFGQDGYFDDHVRVFDLRSDISVTERCRAVRELAERVGGVVGVVNTVGGLRRFLGFFLPSPEDYFARPWLAEGGEYAHLGFEEISVLSSGETPA